MTRAPWLTRLLIQAGAITEDGATRTARARRCPTCGALTILALDADRCAMTARADPLELDPADEAAALIAGRQTWTLRTTGGRPRLLRRDQWSIRAHPAGSTAEPVLAEHACGAPLGRPPPPTTARPALDTSGPPPF